MWMVEHRNGPHLSLKETFSMLERIFIWIRCHLSAHHFNCHLSTNTPSSPTYTSPMPPLPIRRRRRYLPNSNPSSGICHLTSRNRGGVRIFSPDTWKV